jgi:hypothetical protein
MNFSEEIRESYYEQLRRKNELTNALTIPIGVVSVVGGVLFFVLGNITVPFSNFEILQIGLSVGSGVFLMASIYFLCRSYWSCEYGYLPTPKELLQWRTDLVEHHQKHQPALSTREVDDRVAEEFLRYYADNAHINVLNNDKRSLFLYKANGVIICAVVIGLVAGASSIVGSFDREDKVHSVRIVP